MCRNIAYQLCGFKRWILLRRRALRANPGRIAGQADKDLQQTIAIYIFHDAFDHGQPENSYSKDEYEQREQNQPPPQWCRVRPQLLLCNRQCSWACQGYHEACDC